MPSHEERALLAAHGLRRSFGRVPILRNIDVTLHPGDSLAVLGPNGAGKTTLLRTLAGLLRPDGGEIMILGEPAGRMSREARRAIGLLSHHTLLYDDLTLLENLIFAARLYGVDQPVQIALAALEAAALADRAGDLPRQLSRGLQQRAALARALVHSPRIILMDEPFTGLDSAAADRLRVELDQRLSRGAALILVTHDLSAVWEIATRVAVLVQGRWAVCEARSGTLDAFAARYQEMING